MNALLPLLKNRRVVVLTGAGCSTESGIPDYRGPETARRARNPIQFNQFATSAEWRARYWARSAVGWPKIRDAKPNAAHEALATLGWPVITQNVDRLHHKAGSERVVELHGALAEVVCLDCRQVTDRNQLQVALLAHNPHLADRQAEMAPDGDAELIDAATVVPCASCGGPLKPHVVFFGENVPRGRVETALDWVRNADTLLVVGSSLTVFSGYRFVKRASEWGVDVGILNLGPTRGDPLASVCVNGRAGVVLPALLGSLRTLSQPGR